MENRLAEVEIQLAYQEKTLQELNTVVTRQQQEIDTLKRMLELVQEKLMALGPDLVKPQSEETPPPHY